MRQRRFERHLLELLLVQIGVPPERARGDAIVIQFFMGGKSGARPQEAATVSDARCEVPNDAGVSDAGEGMRSRLQGMLSFLHERSRLP